MKRWIDRSFGHTARTLAACAVAAVATVASLAGPARAQGMMQLVVPSAEYTLGRFKYQAPTTDGWRQMANVRDSLSIVYAHQKSENTIETAFGVAIEAHEIPPNVQMEGAAALADISRKQMAEARKADLVAMSGIEAVPSIENLYTYRLLVRSPVPDMPEAYEIYYVMLAPDKTQYLVIQCITKTKEYDKELYFTEFYGSLASLKYVPDAAAKPAEPSAPAPAAEPDGAAAPAAEGH